MWSNAGASRSISPRRRINRLSILPLFSASHAWSMVLLFFGSAEGDATDAASAALFFLSAALSISTASTSASSSASATDRNTMSLSKCAWKPADLNDPSTAAVSSRRCPPSTAMASLGIRVAAGASTGIEAAACLRKRCKASSPDEAAVDISPTFSTRVRFWTRFSTKFLSTLSRMYVRGFAINVSPSLVTLL
eukprot:1133249-Pyramimonas_sp.AAC.1